jgi:signal transduction histidine kinase
MVDTRPLIETAIALLVVAIPAGLAFGTLATRRLLRRLRRLGRASLRVADGDFTPRLAPRGVDDELGRLEANFDTMTARLQDSVEHERELARANATAEERARIARELHDSISQHLFSIRVILAGLHRATSDDEAARRTLVAAERSADDAVREMQALLLELRPVPLEETGLIAALETVFATYRDRLGVAVAADIADVTTDIPVQHAVLRITQEAMTNAVRHGNASVINVNLRSCDGVVNLVVADDGVGFAPAKLDHQGLGLVHMRERAQELGGTFSITSERGSGTAVRVTLPRQST